MEQASVIRSRLFFPLSLCPLLNQVVCMDANNAYDVVAYGIAMSESKESWGMIFQALVEAVGDLFVSDNAALNPGVPRFTLISDRAKVGMTSPVLFVRLLLS